MPGFAVSKDNQQIIFADGQAVARVNVIDYVSAIVVPVGSEAHYGLFNATWSPPSVPNYEKRRREFALDRISDFSVQPCKGWAWAITSVAASHPELVIELTYGERDCFFGGPWLRDGLDLENPINVGPLHPLIGWADRRRCGPGAIYVWLRGFLFRKER